MEIKIQAVHFDATEKLQEFATKKVEKLSEQNNKHQCGNTWRNTVCRKNMRYF